MVSGMEEYGIPIVKFLPPVEEVFKSVNYNFHKLLKTLENVSNNKNGSMRTTLEFIDRYLKERRVEVVAVYGSSIYRMTTKEEVSDIDVLIVYNEFISPHKILQTKPPQVDVCIDSIMGIERLDSDFDKRMAGSGMILFKWSEYALDVIHELRELFVKEAVRLLTDLASRDLFKEINSRRILRYLNNPSDRLIRKIKESKPFLIHDPLEPFVTKTDPLETYRELRSQGFTNDELVEMLKAVLNRRRVKSKYKKRVIDNYFKTATRKQKRVTV